MIRFGWVTDTIRRTISLMSVSSIVINQSPKCPKSALISAQLAHRICCPQSAYDMHSGIGGLKRGDVMNAVRSLVFVLCLTVAATSLIASGQAGVYGIVTKVIPGEIHHGN